MELTMTRDEERWMTIAAKREGVLLALVTILNAQGNERLAKFIEKQLEEINKDLPQEFKNA